MALTTFGAVMGFAADMFRHGEEWFQAAAQSAVDPALRQTLQDLAADQRKTRSLMEMTRREHVTEMILEPIAGLREEEYELDQALPVQPGDAGLLRHATMVEESEMKFLEDCAAKLPLPQVARIFRKLSRKREENLVRLKRMK